MKLFEAIRKWFNRKPSPSTQAQTQATSWSPVPAPQVLDTATRVQMEEIGPDAFITNGGTKDVMLEGTVIRRIFVPAGKTVRVVSPVLERVFDQATKRTKIQEWDAKKTADNMVMEYARAVGYDELTPAECRPAMQPAWEQKTPTNGEAARRPYCVKHHRAKIDIGGEKKCPDCVKEKNVRRGSNE